MDSKSWLVTISRVTGVSFLEIQVDYVLLVGSFLAELRSWREFRIVEDSAAGLEAFVRTACGVPDLA